VVPTKFRARNYLICERFWWTRTHRIRTASALPFQVALVDTAARPVYQRIAPKTKQLRELGLSLASIGRRLGVTDKTVAKAIGWLETIEPRS